MEKVFITKNNVPVYAFENKGIHSFCIGLYVKAGCLYEDEADNGISHFFEHVTFKNLNNSIGMDLADFLDMYSLDINGCTYKEFIQFKITGATKNFRKAAEVITKVLSPLNVSKQDIECERKRIKAEMRESSEKTSLDFFTNNIVWEDTALKNTICGKMKNLDLINFTKLKEFQKAVLSEGNFFFYVTGNFGKEDMDYLSQCIDVYDIKKDCVKRTNEVPLSKNFFNRKENIHIKNSEYTYIRFSFDVDTKKYSPAELDLLFDILFYGEKSAIYKELSDKTGLIYSFDWAFEQYANVGVLYFEFEVRKNKLYDAVSSVIAVLSELKKNGGERLAFVKPRYTDNAELILDHCENFNWERAYECHLLDISYKTIKDKKEAYEEVTADKIEEIFREIFVRNNFILTMKGNKKTTDMNKLYIIIEKLGCME